MKNVRNTRHALVTSLMALLLCFTMLLGTTYAWFTDSVTSTGNKIQAGTLKIDLELYDGDTGAFASIKESKAPIFDYELWEPGYTDVKLLKVENEGNLALKWKATLVGVDVQSTLANVIDVYVLPLDTSLALDDAAAIAKLPADRTLADYAPAGTLAEFIAGIETTTVGTLEAGKSAYLGIALKMQEDAGNEYQNLSLGTFDIQILATQLNAEKDSFDENYDKDAMFAVAEDLYRDETTGALVATSTKGLSSAAAAASEDDSITEVKLATDEGEKTVPVVRDTASMNEKLAAGEQTLVLTEGSYKVGAAAGKDVTFVGTKDTKVDVTSGLTYIAGANATFEGLTIQSEPEGAGYTNGLADARNAVFNNCTINGTLGLDFSCEFNECEFNVEGNYYNVWTWGAGTVSFTKCTFNCDGKALLVYANVLDNGTYHQTVNVTRCTFNDLGDDTVTGKAAIEISNTYTPVRTYDIIINGTTVNGFAQTVPGAGDFNAAYGSVAGADIGTNVWGNKCQLSNTQVNVVIDGVDVY